MPWLAYSNQAHERGLKVKIYYTVRELTNHAAELWALRSLGTEIYKDGSGGGSAWLREHLITGYTPAWHQMLPTGVLDSAILTTGLSRWHNYYLEGLDYLLRHEVSTDCTWMASDMTAPSCGVFGVCSTKDVPVV